MFKYPRPGQGQPASFVPSSQQQHQQGGRSRAIPIVAPSSESLSSDTASSSQQSSSTSHLSPQKGSGLGISTSSAASSPNPRSKRANASGTSRGGANGVSSTVETMSPSSPVKAALSARAASAAVFVPKGVASPSIQSRVTAGEYDSAEEGSGTARLMESMNLGGSGDQMAYNPYAQNESGRGTPNSFGGGGYETDGSVSRMEAQHPVTLGVSAHLLARRTACLIQRIWGPCPRVMNPPTRLPRP